ncbi:hypothetical protein [Jeotgalicoccus psychrophilus]|uniref:hypothetical protein n=1 Tax=Jeotgalicoccus psychrophilus TaxID=157228 RepID=UPI0003FFD9BF|nr:hypothetical protein [Jeotgalicoccus psychrophilus]
MGNIKMNKDVEEYFVDDKGAIWRMLILSNSEHEKRVLHVSRINRTDAMQKDLEEIDDAYKITSNHIGKYNR